MTPELAKRLRQSVENFYERHGAAFSMTRQFVWGEETLVVERLKPRTTVVDVGAGNGRFARLLPPNIDYIGIEPSEALRSAAPQALDMRDGDFPKLPLPDNTADATVCFAVFHHLPSSHDREDAVKELLRVTKPGGLIAVTSWHLNPEDYEPVEGGDPGDIWVPWNAESIKAKRYVHATNEEEWTKLWTRPDFTIEKIGRFGKKDWTKDEKEARNWCVIGKRS